jgi:hypothetical protein
MSPQRVRPSIEQPGIERQHDKEVGHTRMRRIIKVAVVAATALVATAASANISYGDQRVAAAAAPSPANAAAKSGPPAIKVGAASRSVLPTIDGSHDYLAAVNPDPTDPLSPGLFVPEWDQGRVAVGNGDSDSHWVHDNMEVTAVAFQPSGSKQITVVVAANLYMIFGADAEVIRQRVSGLIGSTIAGQLEIAISTDHNHHGPDTAFDINHEWYDLMIDQSAAAIVEAIDQLRPAQLEVAQAEHFFGLRDSRDPQVIDPTLGVLRATHRTTGKTIATMLFWGNHPETTLGWNPPADDGIADECAQINLQPCTIEDRYFTADFPGWATRIIEDELGGEAAYFNGAVGDLITPLGANVWEVGTDAPLGLGLVPPPGAQPPLGATTFQERNFRRAYLIGRELAAAALVALEDAAPIATPTVDYDVAPFYTRMSNIGFRLLTVPGDDGLTALGHTPGMLYTCPPTGPKNDSTCTPDALATTSDPILGQIRLGDHTRSQAAYLRIGPVGMMWLPAEAGPESTIGMPGGYPANPENWHSDDPSLHAFGDEYVTVGYVKNRMTDEYRWIVGLGNDELGYVVPLSDYRISCVADAFAGPGTCAALHAAGVIEFADAIAGATCKAVTEDPSLLADYGPAAEAVAGSCRYGQAFGEANDHYEETNSVGWDIEADILAAVGDLTGSHDTTVINPDFAGWWMGHTPNS